MTEFSKIGVGDIKKGGTFYVVGTNIYGQDAWAARIFVLGDVYRYSFRNGFVPKVSVEIQCIAPYERRCNVRDIFLHDYGVRGPGDRVYNIRCVHWTLEQAMADYERLTRLEFIPVEARLILAISGSRVELDPNDLT